MKKLILLALVALVAGAAFATTDPAFSGTFAYRTQLDFTQKEYAIDDTAGSANINLNGVVDDWSTVNAQFASGSQAALKLNEFKLTTDVTGALGANGPVGFTISWGLVAQQPALYSGVAGYLDQTVAHSTDSYLGAILTFTIVEKVKVIALLAPSSYVGDNWKLVKNGVDSGAAPANPALGFEVQFNGLVEGLDANVWYTNDKNITVDEDNDVVTPETPAPVNEFGISLGYVLNNLNIGFITGGDFDTNIYGLGISAQYTFIDALTAGLAFGVKDFSAFDAAKIGLNLTYTIVDPLDIYVAVSIPFSDFSNALGVDAGLVFRLGATSYTLGYDYNGAGFKGPKITTTGEGMYLKVDASY